MKTTTLNVKDFPAELHKQIKATAALEGLSIKALIIKVMSEYVKK